MVRERMRATCCGLPNAFLRRCMATVRRPLRLSMTTKHEGSSRHAGLVMLLDGDVDAVGELHHDDFGCRQQVIHSVVEHFLRFTLAQPEVDTRVLFEEAAQVSLAIFPVMRGELMLVLDKKCANLAIRLFRFDNCF